MEVETKYKDRQYYMDECYRLRSELKKCREQLGILKNTPPDTQEQLKDKQQEINKLKTKLYLLEQNKPTTKQKEIIKKLRYENTKLMESNKSLKKSFSSMVDNIKLRKEIEVLKLSLKILTTKNKAVFRHYFEKAITLPDDIQTSIGTVILDFEYAFIFQKLFEMHLFDFIVDKQDPGNKTLEDTQNLINVCKVFTTNLLKEQINKTNMNVREIKGVIREFVKPYIETR